jgi:uncharacterized protein YciI
MDTSYFVVNKTPDMKLLITSALLLIAAITVAGQSINPNYDSTLAGKTGADEYGMKMYVLVILKSGSNKVTDKVERDSLFAGHMRNIRKLAGMKKLIVAGPLEDNEKTYRGIFILDVQSFDEAKALMETDPTIKQKVFDIELYQWYGSAALPEYLDSADKIWKSRP